MAKKKKIVRIAKLEFEAGKSRPGPELAGLGIVMPEFTRQFNDATRERGSEPVPVTITVYKDKSFDFKLHTAPASYKIKEAAKIKKGSDNAKINKVATLDVAKVKEIAEYKMPDLNTDNIDQAVKIIAGTAKNMGVLVDGIDDIEKEKQFAKEAAKKAANAENAKAKLEADTKSAIENKDNEISIESIKNKSESSAEGDK